MLRQAENRVKIEGTLSEIDIKTSTFKKNGHDTEAIGGVIIVKVSQKINGQEKELAIPIHMFAAKYTNKGTPNPAYASIEKIANDFTSIASAGDEAKADCIRITSASVKMNEYYSQDGRLVSFPRVTASFVSRIRKEDCHPEASFVTEFVVAEKNDEMDRNGEPTGRLQIKAILPQYGGKVDVFPMFAENENVINAISTYWNIGDTVKATGKLDFSSKTETVLEDIGFGEPVEKIRTINKSDLIITGGSQTPLEGEFAYDNNEIQQALAERKDRLEAGKAKDMSRTSSKAAPAQGFGNLGF